MRNEGFCGLSPEEAAILSNWQHLRPVKQEDKKSMVDRNVHIFNDEFLDSLHCDKPLECWSLMKDVTGGQVILRSQMWPGFSAYHRCNTAVWGAVYIGDGIQNAALPFML
jgi:radial spoke head protein 9